MKSGQLSGNDNCYDNESPSSVHQRVVFFVFFFFYAGRNATTRES